MGLDSSIAVGKTVDAKELHEWIKVKIDGKEYDMEPQSISCTLSESNSKD
jgi:hypothetical protein